MPYHCIVGGHFNTFSRSHLIRTRAFIILDGSGGSSIKCLILLIACRIGSTCIKIHVYRSIQLSSSTNCSKWSVNFAPSSRTSTYSGDWIIDFSVYDICKDLQSAVMIRITVVTFRLQPQYHYLWSNSRVHVQYSHSQYCFVLQLLPVAPLLDFISHHTWFPIDRIQSHTHRER